MYISFLALKFTFHFMYHKHFSVVYRVLKKMCQMYTTSSGVETKKVL
jgi:hypothetical protein